MPRRFSMIRPTALALLAAATTVAPAAAAVYQPTDGTELRAAITAANQSAGFDAIVLGPGIYALGGGPGEDLNAGGDLDILDDLAVVGAGADKTILRVGGDRVLDIHAGATVEILGVTINGGRVPTGNGGGVRNAGLLTLTRVHLLGNQAVAGAGGGVYSAGNDSSLTIAQSAITSNVAASAGGGIALDGTMTLTDSTVSGNSAGTIGGGLYAFDNSDAQIVNATITANRASLQAGGLFAESTPFLTSERPVLRDTILAGNTAPTDRDCGGTPASAGHNLLGVGGACIDFTAGKGDLVGTAAAPLDPKLGTLTNNGGTTPTHALLAGSPALNAGDDCTTSDQRGQARQANTCDIGAFEFGVTCVGGGPTLCLNSDRFKVTAVFKTANGQSGPAEGVELTPDSGYFTFFDPSNVELTVKVLNGCGLNQRYWVFLAGMTNVEVTLTVTDIASGQSKTYTNPQGRTFRTVLDTTAFASCGLTP